MLNPNFSESQLQQAVNSAFIRYIYEKTGHYIFAHVPSLIDEFDLGWDTGFYFPWISTLPNNNHEGCNIFLQYKLSGLLTRSNAKQWSSWSDDYYRFKIPHTTKNKSGKYVDDYHQWHCLKILADSNYPTFYATNSVSSKDKLIKLTSSGKLLDNTPMLDVRTVRGLHKTVTFTKDSSYFLMHSEIEEVNKLSISNHIEQLNDITWGSIEESNIKLLNILGDISEINQNWQADLNKIRSFETHELIDEHKQWATREFIASFIRKHIGANMLWLPKMD